VPSKPSAAVTTARGVGLVRGIAGQPVAITVQL
jgi:hypothetical protein